MPFELNIRGDDRQIVVPIRFACVGLPQVVDHSRDTMIDDRGFEMGTRPPTWAHSDSTRGAMVSIGEGDVVNIKVLREDIDDAANLFVSSTRPDVVAIVGDLGQKQPLASDGIFQAKGIKDLKSSGEQNFAVAIQVHVDSLDGPVIGEMEPHVFQFQDLRIVAHLVTINGVGTTRSAQDFKDLVDEANVIWRATGIRFLYDPTETKANIVTGFKQDGTVGALDDNLALQDQEQSRVYHLSPDLNAINVYCVQAIESDSPGAKVMGETHDVDFIADAGIGVILSDQAADKSGRVLAHELGHFLDLTHADEDGKFHHIRDDIWTENRLMWFGVLLDPIQLSDPPPANPQPGYRTDIGYGLLRPGDLIDLKHLANDPVDGSLNLARVRARHRPISKPLH
jgi:hypothetical protein